MTNSLADNNFKCKTMTLNGQGNLTLIPDVAVIRLGVQTTGESLLLIQNENAQEVQSILQSLKRLGVTDVKTYQYSIDKIYDYENGNRIDKGYYVRNILEIKTRNMSQVGNIIDSAVNAGANVVDLISFQVSEPEIYYQQALNSAINNAIQKSKSISMNLGMKTDPVPIQIIENSFSPLPKQQFQREVAATPIIPGDIQIDASVTVVFLY
nr:SIMPL domain-containing protein [Sedimentibacter sp.]